MRISDLIPVLRREVTRRKSVADAEFGEVVLALDRVERFIGAESPAEPELAAPSERQSLNVLQQAAASGQFNGPVPLLPKDTPAPTRKEKVAGEKGTAAPVAASKPKMADVIREYAQRHAEFSCKELQAFIRDHHKHLIPNVLSGSLSTMAGNGRLGSSGRGRNRLFWWPGNETKQEKTAPKVVIGKGAPTTLEGAILRALPPGCDNASEKEISDRVMMRYASIYFHETSRNKNAVQEHLDELVKRGVLKITNPTRPVTEPALYNFAE
jgi:hypothetical protein